MSNLPALPETHRKAIRGSSSLSGARGATGRAWEPMIGSTGKYTLPPLPNNSAGKWSTAWGRGRELRELRSLRVRHHPNAR